MSIESYAMLLTCVIEQCAVLIYEKLILFDIIIFCILDSPKQVVEEKKSTFDFCKLLKDIVIYFDVSFFIYS